MNKIVKRNKLAELLPSIPQGTLNKLSCLVLVAPVICYIADKVYGLANDAMDKGYGLHIKMDSFDIKVAKEVSLN